MLAEDIARALGSCGHVVRLRRIAVEPFESSAMLSLDTLAALLADGAAPPLLAADMPLQHLPAARLDAGQARRIGQGQAVPSGLPPADPVRLYGPEGAFLGLGRVDPAGLLHARRLFVQGAPAGQRDPPAGDLALEQAPLRVECAAFHKSRNHRIPRIFPDAPRC
ncbi:MAG: tRNA pseudouridine(55) synthase TruB [Steroidobacteraceae bacterium]